MFVTSRSPATCTWSTSHIEISSPISVQYATIDLIPSFHECLDRVAREKIYIEMIEAHPLEKIREFQEDMIKNNYPAYYAVDGNKVVGWCDIQVSKNPRFQHRGGLAMGLHPDYRGIGIGTRLINAALDHAQKIGLEKIDLEVYTTNERAISLYINAGFVQEGLKKNNRKLDGKYFDILLMAKFLTGR